MFHVIQGYQWGNHSKFLVCAAYIEYITGVLYILVKGVDFDLQIQGGQEQPVLKVSQLQAAL